MPPQSACWYLSCADEGVRLDAQSGYGSQRPLLGRANVVGALVLLAIPCAWADPKMDFNIPSGELPKSVVEFYRQSHKEVMFRATPDTEKVVTAAVNGDLEPSEALQRMLEGTALKMKIIEPNSAIIEAAPPPAKSVDNSIDDDNEPVVTISAS